MEQPFRYNDFPPGIPNQNPPAPEPGAPGRQNEVQLPPKPEMPETQIPPTKQG